MVWFGLDWLAVNSSLLLSLTIIANIWPDFPVPIFFPFKDSTLKETFPRSAFRGVASDGRKLRLADLPIVEKIYILNSAVVVIFTCGVVSAFHWQLILEYEGVKESSRWTEKQEKTVDVGTNTDGGGSRVWWKFSGK